MKKILLILILLMATQSAMAGGPVSSYHYSSKEKTETRAYAGLVWSLGQDFKKIPELTLGVSALRQEVSKRTVDSSKFRPSESIEGGMDFSLRFNFDKGITFDSARLLYLDGDRDFLANIGVGYSFSGNRPFGILGVQRPYWRIGMDVPFDKDPLTSPEYFVELLTLGEEDKLVGDCIGTYKDDAYPCGKPPT